MGNKFARVMFSYYDAWKNGFTSDLKHKKCDFLHKNDLKHKKNSLSIKTKFLWRKKLRTCLWLMKFQV